MTMYTILAYISVFRLEELGMSKFREICSSEEPSKVSTFIAYLFNKVSQLHLLLGIIVYNIIL